MMEMGNDSAVNAGPPTAPVGCKASVTEIQLNARSLISTLFVACVAIEISFVLLDYFVNYGQLTTIGPIRRMFNITREDGLASWFGVTQTLLVGLTAWFVWIVRRGQPGVGRWVRIGWLIMACCVTYMAVDDGATIHERLGSTLKAMQSETQQTDLEEQSAAGGGWWFPSYHWQVLFLPVFGAMGIFMLVFLWREMAARRLRIHVALCIACFVVAVALDFVEGLEPGHRLNLYSSIARRSDFEAFTQSRFGVLEYEALRHFSKSIEEALEMFGMTLLWVAFLTHLVRIAPEIRLRLTK
jgi:hypothetical protein